MSKNKYRVKVHQGKFYVQVLKKARETKGFLWWRKEVVKDFWVNCCDDGTPPFRFLRSPTYPMEPFDTLQAAMDKIKLFLSEDKIYEYGVQYEGLKKQIKNL